MPKPTRVFAEDLHLPPLPLPLPTTAKVQVSTSTTEPTEIIAPIPFIPQPNVWDNDQSIDRYVRAVMESHIRRSRPTFQTQARPEDIMSPRAGRSVRRESLVLTDFPSAEDRPSLPVTPAPIRRPTFWGDERDDEGNLPAADNLPAAEGVPDQADWVCPQCGFVSSSPIAFYRPRRKSSAATSSTWRPQAHRTPSSEYPQLPPHLTLHRTSSSSQSAISSTSTAVAPPASTRTAFTKDVSASSPAVPSAEISPEEVGLEHGSTDSAEGLQQPAKTLPEHKLLSELSQQLS
jgi:glycogenin glucosyltransferase